METAMKVAVIGTGMVGAHAAYALVLLRSASDIVLVDQNHGLAQAHAEDIRHATPYSAPVHIQAGDFPAIAGSDVVLLCCGVAQKPGEDRLSLLERNVAVFRAVIAEVVRHAPGAILVVASNPVDVMTAAVRRLSGLPEGRVFGSGTMLDSARFRTLVAEHLDVSPLSVHGYVLGEHGDSEVLAWSTVAISSIPLASFAEQRGRPADQAMRARIDTGVRRAAYQIIAGKGYTAHGIGAALARIVRVIRDDERAVLPLSAPCTIAGREICLSLPRVLGQGGIGPALQPSLHAEEIAALATSAEVLASVAARLG
jgi:L-lactate dehydrogenase